MTNKIKGKQGEEISVNFLKNNGYTILEKNYHHSKIGEIDIIAKKNSTIIAVEVKTRTSNAFGLPINAINRTKLLKIRSTFIHYLQNANIFHLKSRIDIISVFLNPNDYSDFKIEHIKNVEIM